MAKKVTKASAAKKATPKKTTKASAAKKATRATKSVRINPHKLLHQRLDDFTGNCLKEYGSYVVEDRATPDFRDGCKPVHRSAIWAAIELGLHKGKETKKSARIVGDTIGKYHPHGDSACYGAMVTIANTSTPLIHGRGNWGSPTDGAASYRYTEMRLSEFTRNFLADPRYLKVVPYDDNFDGTEKRPRYLPALLPILLLIGNVRAPAFGVSLGNPAFELDGIVKLVTKGLKGKKITTKDCAKYLVPSYPWGGCVDLTPEDDYLQLMETGRGSLTLCPEIETDWKAKRVYVNSYAPAFNNAASVQKKMDKISDIDGVGSVYGASSKSKKVVCEIRMVRGCSESRMEEAVTEITKILTARDSQELGFTFRRDESTTSFHRTGYAKFLNNWIIYRRKLEESYIEWQIEDAEKKIERLDLLLLAVKHRQKIWDSVSAKTNTVTTLTKKLKALKEVTKQFTVNDELSKQLLDIPNRRLDSLEQKELLAQRKVHEKEIKQFNKDMEDAGGRAATDLQDIVAVHKKQMKVLADQAAKAEARKAKAKKKS